PEKGGEKPHLLVMVSLDHLTGHGHGQAETVDGTVLSRSELDYLSCDCSISRLIMEPTSEPIDIGRKSRVIPPAMRRAVIARDRHCQHPGCFRPARWCDVHHKFIGPTAVRPSSRISSCCVGITTRWSTERPWKRRPGNGSACFPNNK
ncbi:MAG: DUF222 domain-containing protein, partial [Acidimicrobiia bacterium]